MSVNEPIEHNLIRYVLVRNVPALDTGNPIFLGTDNAEVDNIRDAVSVLSAEAAEALRQTALAPDEWHAEPLAIHLPAQ